MSLVERLLQWRERLVPPALQVDDQATRTLKRRTIRFITMMLIVAATSAATGVAHLAQGHVAGWGALACALLACGALALVRANWHIGFIMMAFLVLGCLVGASLAIAAKTSGLTALFWLAMAPPMARAFFGDSASFRMLLFTASLMVVSTVIMFTVDYEPLLTSGLGGHLASLLGSLATFHALIHAYERETTNDITLLEAHNADLSRARARADEANRAKGEFLATMSHEIRTPMNGVLGMTSVMLGEKGLPSEVREGLVTIHQSGTTLMAVLNDILDFSKLESGRLLLERAPIDLRSELTAVMALLEKSARERHNSISLTVHESIPPYIVADPVRLRQIALNLLSNAVKFTSSGKVDILATRVGDTLVLEIRDTGIGMNETALASLFMPFTQADASTTRRFGGTGLGLAIVHRLVDAMKGAITVTSQPEHGSCFTVKLPLEVAATPATPSAPAPTPTGRRLKVLLAEDNPVNQRVAVRLLEQLGHIVTVAENGLQALEFVEQAAFDAILMDCHMPVMDGFEATRMLRLSHPANSLPIIALTAASLPEERVKCLNSGMDDVLLKPVRRDDLQAILARVA